jgi:hypothetical protein
MITECNCYLPDFAYRDWLLEQGWQPEEIVNAEELYLSIVEEFWCLLPEDFHDTLCGNGCNDDRGEGVLYEAVSNSSGPGYYYYMMDTIGDGHAYNYTKDEGDP